MPKIAILSAKWSFQRSLIIFFLFSCFAHSSINQKSLPQIPERGIYIGGILQVGQTTMQEFNQITQIKHSLFMEFTSFPEVLNPLGAEYQKTTDFFNQCMGVGAIPILTLELPGGLNSYTAEQIHAFALFLNKFPTPIFLRWCHEMNGSWYPWGQQPDLYRERFAEFSTVIHAQSPSVAMVWTPNQGWGYPWTEGQYYNSSLDPTAPYDAYYPGDDYVDWVGFSFYHWGNGFEKGVNEVPYHGKWQQAHGIENPIELFYGDFSLKRMKPMMIAETSALFDPIDAIGGGSSDFDIKSAWIKQVYNINDPTQAELNHHFPQIKAICWFNQLKYETEVDRLIDWRMTANLKIASFYQKIVSDSYFIKAMYPEDSITILSAPLVINSCGSSTITIRYGASTNRDIQLNLLSTTDLKSYAEEIVSVPVGSGEITFHLPLCKDLSPVDSYIWDIMMVPSGGNRSQKTYEVHQAVNVISEQVIDVIEIKSIPQKFNAYGPTHIGLKYKIEFSESRKFLWVELKEAKEGFVLYQYWLPLFFSEGDVEITLPLRRLEEDHNLYYIFEAYITESNKENSSFFIEKIIKN